MGIAGRKPVTVNAIPMQHLGGDATGGAAGLSRSRAFYEIRSRVGGVNRE